MLRRCTLRITQTIWLVISYRQLRTIAARPPFSQKAKKSFSPNSNETDCGTHIEYLLVRGNSKMCSSTNQPISSLVFVPQNIISCFVVDLLVIQMFSKNQNYHTRLYHPELHSVVRAEKYSIMAVSEFRKFQGNFSKISQ